MSGGVAETGVQGTLCIFNREKHFFFFLQVVSGLRLLRGAGCDSASRRWPVWTHKTLGPSASGAAAAHIRAEVGGAPHAS